MKHSSDLTFLNVLKIKKFNRSITKRKEEKFYNIFFKSDLLDIGIAGGISSLPLIKHLKS